MHSKIQATNNTIWKGWLYLRSWAFLSKKLKGYLRKKKKEEKWEGKWICDSSTLPPKHCKEEYYLEILHRYDCRDWEACNVFFYKNFCMEIVQELRRPKEMQGIIMQYLEWSIPHHQIIFSILWRLNEPSISQYLASTFVNTKLTFVLISSIDKFEYIIAIHLKEGNCAFS